MAASTAKSETAKDFEITREFAAARAVVFEAWSKPEHVVKWWGRKGFTMTFCAMDFRTGGEFRFCWRAPAGQDYWLKGVFLEIVPDERIVFRCALENETLDHDAIFRVTFSDQAGKTRLTLHSHLIDPSKARGGAEHGWADAMESLAAYVEEQQS